MYYLHIIHIIHTNVEHDMDATSDRIPDCIPDKIPDKVLYTGLINGQNQYRI